MMGWISDRRMKTGHGLGGYRKDSPKHGAPLVKIVEVLRPSAGLFDQALVLLECGHQTRSNGAVRARCAKCKIEREAAEPLEEYESERERACYPSSCCGRETSWVRDAGVRSLRACPCGGAGWF